MKKQTQSVGRQWEYDEVGEEEEEDEEKISRRSIARLVKLHFSVVLLLRGARALSRASRLERERKRKRQRTEHSLGLFVIKEAVGGGVRRRRRRGSSGKRNYGGDDDE